jgi:hypothetical protein
VFRISVVIIDGGFTVYNLEKRESFFVMCNICYRNTKLKI